MSNYPVNLSLFIIRVWEETNNELQESGINKDLLASYDFIHLFLLLFYQNPNNFNMYLQAIDNGVEVIINFLKMSFESLERILDINIKYGENYLADFIRSQLKFLNVLVEDDNYFDIIKNYIFEFKEIFITIIKYDGENVVLN